MNDRGVRDTGYMPTPDSMAHKIARHLLDGPLIYRDLRERISERDGRTPTRSQLSVVLDALRERGLVIRRDPETLKLITRPRVQGRSILWDLSSEFRMRCLVHFKEQRGKSGAEEDRVDVEEIDKVSFEKPDGMSAEIFVEMLIIRIEARRIIANIEELSDKSVVRIKSSAREIVAVIDQIFEDSE